MPKEEQQDKRLHWRDYLAILIASLETVFLPLLVMIVILALLVLLVR